MTIKMNVVNVNGEDLITWRENIDRNGPGMSIPLSNKQNFRMALNRMSSVGDEELVDYGEFAHVDDQTNVPIAIFINEVDADDFLTAKGAGYRKDREPGNRDGYDFKVVRK